MDNNLKKIRLKRGWPQTKFCLLCGIASGQEYGMIESGARTPRVDKAIRIAKNLKMKVEDIWFFKK